jgi:hypothetical protein
MLKQPPHGFTGILIRESPFGLSGVVMQGSGAPQGTSNVWKIDSLNFFDASALEKISFT